MKFTETKLKGAYVIELEPITDDRGYFARSFCLEEFKEYDINFNVAQSNISYNKKAGTLRGMHYQVSPHEEAKLLRCTSGAIYDVIIDLRPESPTFRQWHSVTLTVGNNMVFVPPRFAHGFLSLGDNTMLYYLVSEFYHPESERTIRWDDPAIGIRWPNINKIISRKDRDASYI